MLVFWSTKLLSDEDVIKGPETKTKSAVFETFKWLKN